MNQTDVIALLYQGLEKLAPGDDIHTLKALEHIPEKDFELIVDAGCGSGRQTVALAKALNTTIHALDIYDFFLEELNQRAEKSGLAHLIQTYCMDMGNIPQKFQNIDLLWAEGSAYSIGFQNALKQWHSTIRPEGFLAVSELVWFKDSVPPEVRSFFESGYPDMKTKEETQELCLESGYNVLATFELPQQSWIDGYYDQLLPRAQSLIDHEDETMQAYAKNAIREVEVFEQSEGSYGYVFYVLQKR